MLNILEEAIETLHGKGRLEFIDTKGQCLNDGTVVQGFFGDPTDVPLDIRATL